MSEWQEFTAKTVDEALTNAVVSMQTSSDQLEYEVIEEGSSRLLGLISKPAKIRALSGEEMGILIGKRGITLDSLQYLVSLVINRNTEDYMKVKLDTENYRERRKETLENLAHNLAHKVKRIHRPVYLEPMNPYERRVIHSALQKDKYVETHSEGDEPYRKVVITLKPGVDTGYERRGKYSYGNSRYGKRNNGGYRKKYNNSYQKKYDEYEKDSSEDVQDNE